jgi:hypothetical protein
MGAAGAVLDDDQGVDAPQQHGVNVHEVGGHHAAGLRGQELLPGRPGAAGRRADPGVVQDLPDRGRRDQMAEPYQLALDAAVSPGGVFRVAMRITSWRIPAAVAGRPGSRWLV